MDHGTNFDFKDGKLKITVPYEELSTITAHSLNYDVTEHQRTKSLTWALVKHVESQNLKLNIHIPNLGKCCPFSVEGDVFLIA